MTEETDFAPLAAEREAVQPEVAETKAAEAPESTQGLVDNDKPAEADAEEAKAETEAEEEERKSRSQRRRDAKLRVQQELAKAQEAKDAAEKELDKVRKAASGVKRPVEKDFATFEEYQAALATHSTLQALDQRRVAELEEAAKGHFEAVKQREAEEAREDAQAWAAQVEEGRKRYADFDAVMNRAPVQTQQAARLIAQSDYAAEVAYRLGSDEATGRTFADMEARGDWMGVSRLIGRLEAQATAPKPKIATDAPPPITPVKGKSTATKRVEDMNYDEFVAYRASGGTITL